MVDKGAQCVLGNEVRNGVARVFCYVRCPNWYHMFMSESLRFVYIPHEALTMVATRFFVYQRVLAAHVNIIRLSWKMDSVPNLEADGRRKRIDILHRYMLSWTIVDMRALLKLSQEIEELRIVKLLVECFIVVVGQLEAWYALQWYRQIVVIPRIVYTTEYLIWHTNLR